MLKRILSVMSALSIICAMTLVVSTDVKAEEVGDTGKVVDGSYLTHDNYSYGSTSNPMLRGKHLMDGDSIISKTGNGKIYTYGQTTANHDVDFVSVLVYVDRYDESDGLWGFVDGRAKDARDTYYVVSTKTLKVDRGYYYRVHCEHFAGNDDEEMYDSAISYTNGIWIP